MTITTGVDEIIGVKVDTQDPSLNQECGGLVQEEDMKGMILSSEEDHT